MRRWEPMLWREGSLGNSTHRWMKAGRGIKWYLEEDADYGHCVDNKVIIIVLLITLRNHSVAPDCDCNCVKAASAIALAWHDYCYKLNAIPDNAAIRAAVLCVFNYSADWIRPTLTLTHHPHLTGCYRINQHIHPLACYVWFVRVAFLVLNGFE